MFVDLISPVGLMSLVVASVLVSLIPALVIKVLMGAIFFVPVSYLMVLIGLAVSLFLTVFALGVVEFLGGVSMDQMGSFQSSIGLIGGFVFQALCLKLIAPGPRMVMIALWKWCAVLVLQYVVYTVFGFIFIAVFG